MNVHSPAGSKNVLWVLRKGVFGMVVVGAGLHSLLFVGLVSAEWRMQEIARAAVTEATLPKASRLSVERIAIDRLKRAGVDATAESIAVEHGRAPAFRWYKARPGDQMAVTISTRSSAWLPVPVARWCEWFGPRQIRVRVERQMPD